jgi:AraC-like DNA-binding protein
LDKNNRILWEVKLKNIIDYKERYNTFWTSDSIRLILTPSQTAKSIYYYVQETGYFKTTYPYFTERVNLNSFLIIYTISGKGLLKYEYREYSLYEGSIIFINCMKPHFYQALGNEEWEFLWVHFNGANTLGYYEEYTKEGFDILLVQDTFLMESTLRRIISINQKKLPYVETLTSNLIVNILTEILIQKTSHNAISIFLPDCVKDTMKYIDQNFSTYLTLELLAKRVNISKFYLAKEFKQYTGSTVNEYIILSRLSYAKELLKYSELSINEITFSIGLNNVSHFINLFKARENVTPLQFRKEWKS